MPEALDVRAAGQCGGDTPSRFEAFKEHLKQGEQGEVVWS